MAKISLYANGRFKIRLLTHFTFAQISKVISLASMVLLDILVYEEDPQTMATPPKRKR